jgi:calcineurin-like phosphoesterase family protein
MADFFTSDTHYGHENIIKYCKRPFSSVQEMNDGLVKNINEKVGQLDTLWHLGDFSMGGESNFLEFRKRINCQNVVLILGNHDSKKVVYKHKSLFKAIHEFYEYSSGNGFSVVMCHYALKVWNKSHYGRYHLYGHSHGTLPDDPNSLSFDIGVDCHNFMPLSVEEIKVIMSKKTWKPVDHHNERTT